jgi:tape measure domain-containing protein
VGSLADVYVRIRGDVTSLKDDTRKGAESAGQEAGSAFHNSFTGMIKQAAVYAGSILTGSAIYNLGKMGLQAAADMQQAQVAFTTLIGNTQQAQKFLGDLKSFAAATPFELPGLINDARLLLGVGEAAQNVIPSLTAWGNASGALGLSGDAFHRVMIALSQSMSAGKINAGDMNQIIEAGIPIWKLMAEATGKTVPELRKLSEQGKLMSADILPKLEAQMQKDYGGAMAAQSKTLAGVWSTFTDTVKIGMSDALTPLIPLLSSAIPAAASFLGGALSTGSKAVAEFIKQFGAGIGGSGPLAGFGGWMNTAGLGLRALFLAFKEGDVTSNGFVGNMERVGVIARDVWGALQGLASVARSTLVPALAAVAGAVGATVGWLLQHRQVAYALVGVITALVLITKAHAAAMAVEAAGGLIKYIAQMNIVTALTKVWTAVQWLLNVAMDANPIGLVVIAIGLLVVAFVLLWNHSEGFRKFFINLWHDIWGVLKAVGAWFAGPFVDFFVGNAKALAAPFIWLWHNGIEPAWEFLKAVGRWFAGPFVDGIVAGAKLVAAPFLWLWHNVMEPAWNGIVYVIDLANRIISSVFNLWTYIMRNTVGVAVLWLWHNVMEPTFNGIANLALWLWGSVLVPAFNGIVAAGKAVGDFFVWLWHNAIEPAVHGIADAATWVWRSILVPAFNGIVAAGKAVGSFFTWLWQNAVMPAVHGVGDAVSWVWNSVIHPSFDAIMNIVGRMRDVFRDVFGAIAGFISSAFSNAVGIVRGAINGIIGVINGAIGGVNSIIDKANSIPGVDFPHIPQIPRLATGGLITKGGRVLLGEVGAEVVDLPVGAAVYPHGSVPAGTGDTAEVEALLREILDAVQGVAPGVGEAINGTGTQLRRLARAGV